MALFILKVSWYLGIESILITRVVLIMNIRSQNLQLHSERLFTTCDSNITTTV